MLTYLREKLLDKFAALLRLLRIVIVPLDGDGRKFKRYRVVHQGWIWYVIPRLVLESLEEMDIPQLMTGQVNSASQNLVALADQSTREIQEGIKRSAATRAARIRTRFNRDVNILVSGSESVPSALLQTGRTAIQSVHRDLIETIGKVGRESFERAVKKTLAQMLAYAREEVGVAVHPEKLALPHGTRFVYEGDPLSLYVIEESPRVRTIFWDEERRTLSFPYVVFVLYLQQGGFHLLQVFFRNEPLTKLTDELFIPTLPDIMEAHGHISGLRAKQYVCFPGPTVAKGAPALIATSTQKVFWESRFLTLHWREHYRTQTDRMENFSVRMWRDLSLKDPGFILKTKWIKSPLTIEALIADIKRPGAQFDARRALTKLEHYVAELSVRISGAIQEAILDLVATSSSYTTSQLAFENRLKKAIEELNFGEQLKTLIETEITTACAEEKVEVILETVSKKTASRFNEIMMPFADQLAKAVTDTLNGRLG